MKRRNAPVEDEIWLKARKEDDNYLRGACMSHGLWSIVIRLIVWVSVLIAAVKFVGISCKFDWSKMVLESPYFFWFLAAPMALSVTKGIANLASKLAWRCYDRMFIRKCKECRANYLRDAIYSTHRTTLTEDDLRINKLLRKLELRYKAEECWSREHCVWDILIYWNAVTDGGLAHTDVKQDDAYQFFGEIAREVPGFTASNERLMRDGWAYTIRVLRYIGTERDSAAQTRDTTTTPTN